ncbi:hypothetical protein DL96DRAFT_1557176 [Flagelloscypha sp. PMI_526]|nr:hypothetical protein DL96DRAFT_1557176 [Flagelloscypha sp. PMI_526]
MAKPVMTDLNCAQTITNQHRRMNQDLRKYGQPNGVREEQDRSKQAHGRNDGGLEVESQRKQSFLTITSSCVLVKSTVTLRISPSRPHLPTLEAMEGLVIALHNFCPQNPNALSVLLFKLVQQPHAPNLLIFRIIQTLQEVTEIRLSGVLKYLPSLGPSGLELLPVRAGSEPTCKSGSGSLLLFVSLLLDTTLAAFWLINSSSIELLWTLKSALFAVRQLRYKVIHVQGISRRNAMNWTGETKIVHLNKDVPWFARWTRCLVHCSQVPLQDVLVGPMLPHALLGSTFGREFFRVGFVFKRCDFRVTQGIFLAKMSARVMVLVLWPA